MLAEKSVRSDVQRDESRIARPMDDSVSETENPGRVGRVSPFSRHSILTLFVDIGVIIVAIYTGRTPPRAPRNGIPLKKMNAPDRKKEKGRKKKKGAFGEGGGGGEEKRKEIKGKRYVLTLNPSARGREDTSFEDADRSAVEPFRSRLQHNTHARTHSLVATRHGHMDT